MANDKNCDEEFSWENNPFNPRNTDPKKMRAFLIIIILSHIGFAIIGEFFMPKGYAVLSEDCKVLTFYYDMNIESRDGKVYLIQSNPFFAPKPTEPKWLNDNCVDSVTTVVFDESFYSCMLQSTSRWFYNLRHLSEVSHIDNLRTGVYTINNTSEMFYGCVNLKTITADHTWRLLFDYVEGDHNMFYGCISLAGGNGTRYDAKKTGKEYARIDGGAANPGYFTIPSH